MPITNKTYRPTQLVEYFDRKDQQFYTGRIAAILNRQVTKALIKPVNQAKPAICIPINKIKPI